MWIDLDDEVSINTEVPIAYLLEGVGHRDGSDAEIVVTKITFVGDVEPLFVNLSRDELLDLMMQDHYNGADQFRLADGAVQLPLPVGNESSADYLNRITEAGRRR